LSNEAFGAGRNLLGSSRLKGLVRAMEAQMPVAADRVLQAVLLAHDGHPGERSEERVTELREMFQGGMQRLGRDLGATLKGRNGTPVTPEAIRDAEKWDATVVNAALAVAESEMRARQARIRAHVLGAATHSSTNFHFGDNAVVASLTANSPGATVSVTQSVTQHHGPAGAKFLAAVERLSEAVEAADLEPRKRLQVLEVLDAVKSEVAKPEPNEIAIGSILSGLNASVSMIRNAPEVLVNVLTAWDVLLPQLQQLAN
jgi:hypothetical protein